MEIEKIFRPSKYFVFFCVGLIIIWFALQSVSRMRVANAAKHISGQIFNWQWNKLGWKSQTEVTSVKIIKKGDMVAVVEVQGKQTLTPLNDKHETVKVENCMARLIFYKSSNNWIVGTVELE